VTPQPLKPRVLIVDDHPANLAAFETVLEGDYTVRLVDSGYKALEATLKDEFAVILLDVRMPGMDGFETAEALRKRDKLRFTPIIFTSAFDKTMEQMTRGYVAGATDFLFSPVEADLLKLKVATYTQTYLRNESLRLQIQQLSHMINDLRLELAKRGLAENGLKARIRNLEQAMQQLEQQADVAPF
jgi:response regulator RpfG family c-di-GMP phosphodiesterase